MSCRSNRLSGQPNESNSLSNGSSRHFNDAAAGPSSLQAHQRAGVETASGTVPYFEEWPTEMLQAEVKKYGFKVSRKRSTLIDQLKAVYEALQRAKAPFESPVIQDKLSDTEPKFEVSAQPRTQQKPVLPATTTTTTTTTASAGKGRAKGNGRKSDPFVLDASSDYFSSPSPEPTVIAENNQHFDGEEAGDYTAQLEREAASATDGFNTSTSEVLPPSASASPRKPRRRPSRTSSTSSSDIFLSTLTSTEPPDESVESGGDEAEPSPDLAQRMTLAIRSDAAVWCRILRYEPISFDEVVSIATRNGVSMDAGKRKELRTWLDRQCICFYSAELTGTCSRH